ncbi:MAG: hypothetical protein R3281_00080 [Balneolaceae bacterium]|nr:hypothetical protein [Balneolaceae bacterium]
MHGEVVKITRAVDMLKANLNEVARVIEWAHLMGYNSPKKFSRKFLRHYTVRPQRVLEYTRVKSIVHELRKGSKSNFEIAITHGIPDEKGLNKFTNYHLGCCPTAIKQMTEEKVESKMEKLAVRFNNVPEPS